MSRAAPAPRFRPVVEADLPRLMEIEAAGFRHPWSERLLRDERGRELFDLPRAPRPPGDTPAPVRFLAEWDNVLLGHTPDNRRRVIAEEHRKAIYGANLLVPPTVWVDGFVAGTWKVQRARTTAKLQVTMFDGVGKAARAEVVDEGEALLRFLEEDASKREVRIA